MAAAGLLADPVRFAYYGLEEPTKDEVLGGGAANHGPADRRLRAFLLNLKTGESTDVVVSLTERQRGQRAHGRHRGGGAAADHRLRVPPGRGDRGRRPGLAGGHGAARSHRHEQDQDRADHGGRLPRARRGRRAADGPRARLPAGPGARPGLGAPRRRGHRARGPDREEGAAGRRRVRAAGARRIRRLRRPGRARAGAHRAAADRDHPAGRAELHGGGQPAALAGLVAAGGLRRCARGSPCTRSSWPGGR